MRRGQLAATVAIVLLFALTPMTMYAGAQSSQTCTPTTCEQVYPSIGVMGEAPVQSNPEPPVFDGDMYVANTGSNTVSVIQGTTNIANVSVGQSPLEPAVDYGGLVYVPNSGSNTVSILSGARAEATVSVGSVPLTPAYDPDNGYVYVPDSGGCTVSFQGAQCGDTVSVIKGTQVIATIQVGTGPEQPVVNTNPGSSYFGYVYVPDALDDPQTGNGTVSVISPTTDSVVLTLELGYIPPSGAIFDPVNGLVYAGPYVINGTTVLGELPVACNSQCVIGQNGDLYSLGGTTLFIISGTQTSTTFCQPCGGYGTFDPVNGWLYAGWAVSGTTPFSTLGVSTEASGVHDGNSFDSDNGFVYASCGGCYYDTGTPPVVSEHFGNVVFLLGNSCGQPGPGYYYNDTLATICNGGSGQPIVTSQSLQIINGTTDVPEALGVGIVFSVQVDSTVLATGKWTAYTPTNVNSGGGEGKISFTVTGPNGTTGWATIKIPRIYVGVNLLVQLGANNGAPASAFTTVPQLYIDGAPTKVFSWSSDQDFFYITFRVHFSTHVMTIVWLNVANSTGTTNSGTSTGISSVSGPSSTASTPVASSSSSVSTTSSAASSLSLQPSYLWPIAAEAAIVLAALLAVRARGRPARDDTL